MKVNELRDFIFKSSYNRLGFSKENSYYSMKCHKKKDLQLFAIKLTEKMLDPSNAEKNNSYLKWKNKKSVKQSKMITQQLKSIENPSIADIKWVIIEHQKTLNKL